MIIQIRLSQRDFFKFSFYDIFRQKRGWVRPTMFAIIFAAASTACFMFHTRPGAMLLGTILIVVALGLPTVWILNFFLSIRRQARKQGLGGGKYVYTLNLEDQGLTVNNGQECALYFWKQIHAYRTSNAVYLYVTSQRAFLIPYICLKDSGDQLWQLIQGYLLKAKKITL